MLASKNRQNVIFYGHLITSNVPLKFLKIYVLWRCFFEKQKLFKLWTFLLVKNIGKDILDLKILITRDHSSLNYRPLNLLFRFTDSTIGHPYIDKDINTSKASIFNTHFSIKVPISEVIIKMYPYLKVWSFCVHWPYNCSPFNF